MSNDFLSILQNIQSHINVINGELARTQTDVMWLKASFWELMSYIRIITGGVVVGIILSIWNLFLIKKNGRRN